MSKTMKVDGQFIVQKRNTQSFFDYDLEDSSNHNLFSAPSTTSSTSTGTRTSYADIVKITYQKSQPLMKIKTKTSDDESVCSEITQDPFLLKCTLSLITNLSEHQEKPVPNKNKKHNDNTRKSNKACATRFDVKKPQKNEFLDETSIGEIMMRNQELNLVKTIPHQERKNTLK